MRNRISLGLIAAAVLFVPSCAFSQTVEVNRQNRTIEVMVTETVRVDADLANIVVGCITYGQTHDQAYQTNLAVAEKVTNALVSSGLSKDQIESNTIELAETNAAEFADPSPAIRKARQFKAHQSWRVHVHAGDAQKLIDIAVKAGANGVEEVNWEVADEESLEGKARMAAMEKACRTAGELAKSVGAKLGDLLYGSNMATGMMFAVRPTDLQTVEVSAGGGFGLRIPPFSLKLFPEKVSKQATVRTVFAIE